MPSGPIATGTAAGGTSLAGCVLILWLLWKYLGIEFPPEVSAAFVTFMTPIVHAVLLKFERATSLDVNGNGKVGNGSTTEQPK